MVVKHFINRMLKIANHHEINNKNWCIKMNSCLSRTLIIITKNQAREWAKISIMRVSYKDLYLNYKQHLSIHNKIYLTQEKKNKRFEKILYKKRYLN